jgi:hypothetical protein
MALCECGCGNDAGIYRQTNRQKGRIKGQPKRFIDHHNNRRIEHATSLLCEKGHLRTPENSYPSWVREGKLRCRICTEERTKRQREAGTHYSVREDTEEIRRKGQKFIDMKMRYGLTREQYEIILGRQKGRCAICSVVMDSSHPNLVPSIDHVHIDNEPKYSVKQIRGLLCGLCNRGLGQFQDSVELLEKAAHYLKETQWNQPFTASSLAMDLGLEAGRIQQLQQSSPDEGTYMTFAATASQAS